MVKEASLKNKELEALKLENSDLKQYYEKEITKVLTSQDNVVLDRKE